MASTLLLRRGPADARESIVPVAGEIVLDTTNNLLYVGDGTTPGGILITNSSANVADKIADGDLKLYRLGEPRPKFILDDWESVVTDSDDMSSI